jgi:hypothetical protein
LKNFIRNLALTLQRFFQILLTVYFGEDQKNKKAQRPKVGCGAPEINGSG